ncbi:unnamed protein product, partial [Ectocarpus sp. 8 AP-2014]
RRAGLKNPLTRREGDRLALASNVSSTSRFFFFFFTTTFFTSNTSSSSSSSSITSAPLRPPPPPPPLADFPLPPPSPAALIASLRFSLGLAGGIVLLPLRPSGGATALSTLPLHDRPLPSAGASPPSAAASALRSLPPPMPPLVLLLLSTDIFRP